MEQQELLKLRLPPPYDVHSLNQQEFKRTKGQCYLDHAAATLYSDSQIHSVMAELQSSLLGNPHSRHLPSDAATQIVESVRHRILAHFNTSAKAYDVIFTSGATEAIRIVAENFDWSATPKNKNSDVATDHEEQVSHESGLEDPHFPEEHQQVCGGVFVYLRENHTSVLGMRELAHQAGSHVYCLPTTQATHILGQPAHSDTGQTCSSPSMSSPTPQLYSEESDSGATHDSSSSQALRNCLFAYSAQCNFSGSKLPLAWVEKVHRGALREVLHQAPINSTVQQAGQHSMSEQVCGQRWYVLLDAAGLAATCPLDLTHCQPDFVPISFYKIFGYPTGLGCLLVHRRAWGVLKKRYYGGGTVLMIDSRKLLSVPRPSLHDRFEDGTVPYLSVAALRHGFDSLQKLTGGVQVVQGHVYQLARYTHHSLASLRHGSGAPVARLYSGEQWSPHTHGGIVTFNLLHHDGSFVGYAQVERMASLYNIHLRTGCLCNPGACQTFLGISEETLLSHFQAGHVCGDARDLVDGAPTGAVRVSFGYMSSYDDADCLLTMVRQCFVSPSLTPDLSRMNVEDKAHLDANGNLPDTLSSDVDETQTEFEAVGPKNEHDELEETVNRVYSQESNSQHNPDCHTQGIVSDGRDAGGEHTEPGLRLTDIMIYPVKSCGGLSVQRWGVGHKGLLYDRHWMIVSKSGVALTQKRCPDLCNIKPHIDLKAGLLTLSCQGEEDISIPLEYKADTWDVAAVCGGRVCRDRVEGLDCGPLVGAWLSGVLGQPHLHLLQQTHHRPGKLSSPAHQGVGEDLSLVNEGQILVLHRASVRSLLQHVQAREETNLTEEELVQRFRGNLVVDGGAAYEEDTWTSLTVGPLHLQVQGGCRRCHMVCIDPYSGQRSREPLLTLAATRGSDATFGVLARHLRLQEAAQFPQVWLAVGAAVRGHRADGEAS